MKQPIEWHEKCLANLISSWERAKEAVTQAQNDAQRIHIMVLMLEQQIAEAKARGMNGFDPDRFLQKKG